MDQAFLGKADWLYVEEIGMHVPACTILRYSESLDRLIKCGNGPLVGEAIQTGDCGEHGY